MIWKNIITKIINICLVIVFLSINIISVLAGTTVYKVTSDGVNIRSVAGTTGSVLGKVYSGTIINILETIPTSDGSTACSTGLWHKFNYNSSIGYICSTFISSTYSDPYNRPWTSPKASIIGGAKFISNNYIAKGQDTSYFKKFNVNPSAWSYNSVYNHQYMANLRAPASEAYTSYNAYSNNGLLDLPLVFSIPIFNNMPDYTTLPNVTADTSGQDNITDQVFEDNLNAQGFSESYKRRLRLLHNIYPNWTFQAVNNDLNFSSSVSAEKAVSSVEIGTGYCDVSSGAAIITESGWCISQDSVVAYYLDPRNFLNATRILQFEKLSYSSIYTENIVQTVLNNTFMSDISLLDNQTYASIFVEAGLPSNGNISAVYLASLSKQEVGINGSKASTGEQFTYKNITYKSLYNFYNIGAYGSEQSPVLAGLVWASGGDTSVIISAPITDIIINYMSLLGVKDRSGFIIGFPLGTTVENIKTKISSAAVTIKNSGRSIINASSKIGTDSTIEIVDSQKTYSYPIMMYGDLNGDGSISASDYVLLKKHILGQTTLIGGSLLSSDVNKSGEITASDYVLIKNNILGKSNILQD